LSSSWGGLNERGIKYDNAAFGAPRCVLMP
jgi:hypothetical protein